MLRNVFPSFFGFWLHKKELLLATRPLVSLYVFLLTILSFAFYGTVPWSLALSTALCLAVICSSIQLFNDYRDRKHDVRKGKFFALQNSRLLLDFWFLVNSAAAVSIMVVSSMSTGVAIFCAVIWVLGIAYSFLQKVFIVQNFIVALCASLPSLCGHVFYCGHDVGYRSGIIFVILLAIVFVREVIKDIQDRNIDRGWKNTLPVVTCDWTNPDDTFRILKPPYPLIIVPIEEVFPGFKPEIFPTIEMSSLVVGWFSLASLGLGPLGVIILFMMMGIVLMLQLVLRNPDRFVLSTKNFVDATILMIFALMYIDVFGGI